VGPVAPVTPLCPTVNTNVSEVVEEKDPTASGWSGGTQPPLAMHTQAGAGRGDGHTNVDVAVVVRRST
jgi:hypothetical protein